MEGFTDTIITTISLIFFILSGTLHEYMHAWTAKKLGDYTATVEGRLTLNPLAHLDLVGTILMVLAGFGWMKPVPVNEYNFKNRTRDMALTAAAGPATNLLIALSLAIPYHLIPLLLDATQSGLISLTATFIQSVLFIGIYVNIALMIFNLIPVPPLDGSRILRALLPSSLQSHWESLEKYSFLLLILLLLPFSPLSSVTSTLIRSGVNFFLQLLT